MSPPLAFARVSPSRMDERVSPLLQLTLKFKALPLKASLLASGRAIEYAVYLLPASIVLSERLVVTAECPSLSYVIDTSAADHPKITFVAFDATALPSRVVTDTDSTDTAASDPLLMMNRNVAGMWVKFSLVLFPLYAAVAYICI